MLSQLDWKGQGRRFSFKDKVEKLHSIMDDVMDEHVHKYMRDKFSNGRGEDSSWDIGKVDISMNWLFYESLVSGSAKIYKIAEQFGYHLSKTNLDIPIQNISINVGVPILIEFPDCVSFEGSEGEIYRSCLVIQGIRPNEHTLQLLTINQKEGEEARSAITIMGIGKKHETINKAIDAYGQKYGETVISKEMINYVVKCLVYINSERPDFTVEGQPLSTSTKPKNESRMLNKGTYPFPLIHVGYGFHGKRYSIDQGLRAGHFRWQRYGPLNSLVKLIWIDQTTVTYSK